MPILHGGLLWDNDLYVTKPALPSFHGLWRIRAPVATLPNPVHKPFPSRKPNKTINLPPIQRPNLCSQVHNVTA